MSLAPRPLLPALALLFGAAVAAPAQPRPVVDPGGVATIVPAIPVPRGLPAAGPVEWTIVPATGLRVFEPLAGKAEVPASAPLRLPVALWIGPEQPAGPLRVGEVALRWPDGRETRRDLEVAIAPRRTPLLGEVGTVEGAPGEVAEIVVDLSVRGNLADTVSVRATPPAEWGLAPAEEKRVVSPDARVLVPVRLLIPPRARPGEVRRVTIAATGRDSASSTVARVLVVRAGGVGGLETLPTSVFVGTAGGGGRSPGGSVVAAVDARGRIGRETDVWLSARDPDVVGTATAFRRLATGPELRLGARRGGIEAELGEIAARREVPFGGRLWGRGGSLRWDGESTRAEAFLARPEAGPARSGDGHLALGAVTVDVARLELGVALSDLARPVGTDGRATARAATVSIEAGRTGASRLRAEVGALRLVDARDRRAAGPTAGLEWSWRGAETTTVLRARRVPATAAGTGTHGNTISLGASRTIAGPFSVSGRAFWDAYPALDPDARSSHRGGGAAVRFGSGPVRLQAGASVRRSTYAADAIEPGESRSAWASAHLPLGAARLDLRAETAVERSGGGEIPSRAFHATIPWSGARGWLSVGASAWTGGFGGDRLQARAAGEVDLSPVTLGGALYVRRGAGRVRSEGYGAVSMDVASDLAAVLGVERDGAEDAWSFSLGIRKRFGMPLPFPRAAAVSGVVYDDRDADGHRGPGEPGLPGVRIVLGPLETTTDGTGRFRFEEAPIGGGRVRVDLASLDAGAVAPPEVELDADGRVRIPVVRPGSLEVTAFFDRDGDGTRGPDEPSATGARVEVAGEDGRRWTAPTDGSGRARFSALVPGDYRVVVTIGASLETRAVEGRARARVEAGGSASVAVPLGPARKEIRFATSPLSAGSDQ